MEGRLVGNVNDREKQTTSEKKQSPEEKEFYRIKDAIDDKLVRMPFRSHQSMFIRALWKLTYRWNFKKTGGVKRCRLKKGKIRRLTGLTKQDVYRAKKELLAGRVVNEIGGEVGFNENTDEWKIISQKKNDKEDVPW